MTTALATQENRLIALSVPEMEKIAVHVVASNFFGVKTKDQALTLMLLCQSEGLHPIQAMRRYHIIEGKPSMRADAMQAEFQRRGGRIKWIERTDEICTAEFSHDQGGSLKVSWSMEDARRAFLADRPTWKKHPRQMLSARVVSEGIRAVLPEVVSGIYTPEEVQDFDALPSAGPSPIPSSGPAPLEASPAPEVEVVDDTAKLWKTRIHFGINRGLMISELSPNQREYYFDKWLKAKRSGVGPKPSEEDETLMRVLETLSAPAPAGWRTVKIHSGPNKNSPLGDVLGKNPYAKLREMADYLGSNSPRSEAGKAVVAAVQVGIKELEPSFPNTRLLLEKMDLSFVERESVPKVLKLANLDPVPFDDITETDASFVCDAWDLAIAKTEVPLN